MRVGKPTCGLVQETVQVPRSAAHRQGAWWRRRTITVTRNTRRTHVAHAAYAGHRHKASGCAGDTTVMQVGTLTQHNIRMMYMKKCACDIGQCVVIRVVSESYGGEGSATTHAG